MNRDFSVEEVQVAKKSHEEMLNIPGHKRNADITGGSKMVTRAQKQTA
jgi:hypothetical protein